MEKNYGLATAIVIVLTIVFGYFSGSIWIFLIGWFIAAVCGYTWDKYMMDTSLVATCRGLYITVIVPIIISGIYGYFSGSWWLFIGGLFLGTIIFRMREDDEKIREEIREEIEEQEERERPEREDAQKQYKKIMLKRFRLLDEIIAEDDIASIYLRFIETTRSGKIPSHLQDEVYISTGDDIASEMSSENRKLIAAQQKILKTVSQMKSYLGKKIEDFYWGEYLKDRKRMGKNRLDVLKKHISDSPDDEGFKFFAEKISNYDELFKLYCDHIQDVINKVISDFEGRLPWYSREIKAARSFFSNDGDPSKTDLAAIIMDWAAEEKSGMLDAIAADLQIAPDVMSSVLAKVVNNSTSPIAQASSSVAPSPVEVEQRPVDMGPKDTPAVGSTPRKRSPLKNILVAGIAVVLLSAVAYWGYTQKTRADAVQLEAQRAAAEVETRERIQAAETKARQEAEARVRQEMEAKARKEAGDRLAAEQAQRAQAEAQARAQAQQAPAAPTPRVAENAASAAAPTAASCATLELCVNAMLNGAYPRKPELIEDAAARLAGFNRAARGDRKAARAKNQLGLDALQDKNYPDAVDLLKQAARDDPADIEIVSNLAFVLIQANRLDEAMASLYSALTLDPRRTTNWIAVANIFGARGQESGAIRALLLGYEFSGNQEKTVAFFTDKANSADNETLRKAYARTLEFVSPTP